MDRRSGPCTGKAGQYASGTVTAANSTFAGSPVFNQTVKPGNHAVHVCLPDPLESEPRLEYDSLPAGEPSMPDIYRIEYSEGLTATAVDDSVAGAVIFDGRLSGDITPGEYQALLVGDRIEPLPHPLERSTLHAHKETYLSASLKGVLLRVGQRICLRCGTLFDSPAIVFSSTEGCLPVLSIALAVFLLLRFQVGLTIGTSSLAAGMTLFIGILLFQLIGKLYVRVRFSERQARIAQRQCPSCGSDSHKSVCSLAGKRLRIGDNGEWIEVSLAGMS